MLQAKLSVEQLDTRRFKPVQLHRPAQQRIRADRLQEGDIPLQAERLRPIRLSLKSESCTCLHM